MRFLQNPLHWVAALSAFVARPGQTGFSAVRILVSYANLSHVPITVKKTITVLVSIGQRKSSIPVHACQILQLVNCSLDKLLL